MHNLADSYSTGNGVARDKQQAMMWFARAADLDFAPSQYNLGVFYAAGDSVTKDYIQAYKWFAIAAASGLLAANTMRDSLAQSMRPEQIFEAEKQVREWSQTHNMLKY